MCRTFDLGWLLNTFYLYDSYVIYKNEKRNFLGIVLDVYRIFNRSNHLKDNRSIQVRNVLWLNIDRKLWKKLSHNLVTDITSKKWHSLSTKKLHFFVFCIFKFWWKIDLDQNLIQLQAFDGLGQSGIINSTFGRWLRLHVSILLRILFDTKTNQFVKKIQDIVWSY